MVSDIRSKFQNRITPQKLDLGKSLGRTFTRSELDEIKDEANLRKTKLTLFCSNNNFNSMDRL